MIIKCKVVPKSKSNSISWYDKESEILKLNINAVPEKGKANEKIIIFLSEFFKIPKSLIRIKSGETSKIKEIEIDKQIDIKSIIK
ncbi:MAG TPA: DUF167 domain-containing protein [Spirochaetota bacterium]|nr:DUF167 domain-containing protein [Spirochaetota bacterium]HOM38692.1 DUF167 domain-containing protein [Spirochaetota bacterium]HPQ49792.1 DUF167 domain-containing protein [Spirochaetota bacterium]